MSKFHSNIQKQNFYKKHNKQKMFLDNDLLLGYNAIVYHLIALQVDIIAPAWIPLGILNICISNAGNHTCKYG